MDAIYRYQRYVYDATRKYYLLGRDRLLDELQPPPGGSVLEIACGTGRNLILAARRYPEARFYGFDISTAMLDTAPRSIARSGLDERIGVARGGRDRLLRRTAVRRGGVRPRVHLLCAVDDPAVARRAAAGAGMRSRPAGGCYIVDFGEQARLPRWFRSGLARLARQVLGRAARRACRPSLQRSPRCPGMQRPLRAALRRLRDLRCDREAAFADQWPVSHLRP